jgi:hypothetical protein
MGTFILHALVFACSSVHRPTSDALLLMSSFFSGVSSLSVMVQGLRQVPRWVHNTPQYTCVFFPIFKMSELCLLFCRDGLAIILLMLLLLLRTRSCACYRMFRFGFFKYPPIPAVYHPWPWLLCELQCKPN